MLPELSEDVINQIKGFDHSFNSVHKDLTEEQKSLIDELIQNEKLKEEYGLCRKCNQPRSYFSRYHLCNSKHFQQDFDKWTSGNKEIDEFIQKVQLNATCRK